jgi:hypothetical protein
VFDAAVPVMRRSPDIDARVRRLKSSAGETKKFSDGDGSPNVRTGSGEKLLADPIVRDTYLGVLDN